MSNTPFSLTILWQVVKDIRAIISQKNNNAIEALGAVRKAFNYTYNYLKNNHGNYVPNMELADLWNDASVKVMKVDRGWGDLLANKSRFWTHPDIYIELNEAVDIPTLEDIVNTMEQLRLQIQ
jgi:hypothetical protein